MLSKTEENYLKALFHLTILQGRPGVGTNELAADLDVKPATVTDMLKKLKEKELVDYKKYGKISLTENGKARGVDIIRKHRLWETFLYEKLDFNWDEVHEVAEQLEHIHSQKLIDGIDHLLGYPKFDPHGDAIPSKKGEFTVPFSRELTEIAPGTTCKVIAVNDNSASFLQYAQKIGIALGIVIQVTEKEDFDKLITLKIGKLSKVVSENFATNILVVKEGDQGF